MNIVAVNGSPTGAQGSTGRLLAALIEGACEAGAAVTLFELGQLTVKPCTSCRTCQQTGSCVIDDDYPRIKAAMIAAGKPMGRRAATRTAVFISRFSPGTRPAIRT